MNTYTEAVMKELESVSSHYLIYEIKRAPLRGAETELSLNDSLVDDICENWSAKGLFDSDFGTDQRYRSYVRDVIIRYSQNRSRFKTIYDLGETSEAVGAHA
ncbi:MAG: hypothetical protein J6Z46_01130 [Lachnospiraceae bacterium]|nr:hypothetical protein [Lachnospiraceae bacterium]